jgi:hypothetical protein
VAGSLKPLAHWAIYKGFKMRFTRRTPAEACGVCTRPDGTEIGFRYYPPARILELGELRLAIDEHGWEIEQSCDHQA